MHFFSALRQRGWVLKMSDLLWPRAGFVWHQPFVFFFCFVLYCFFVVFEHAVWLINIPCRFNTNQGGSVGKGTAVKDKADIDCVVFFNDVKTMEEHKLKLQQTKDSLESCLKHSSHRITFGKQTPYAVKFRLNSSQEFNIDLLPTFTTDQSLGKIGILIFLNPTLIIVHCLLAR